MRIGGPARGGPGGGGEGSVSPEEREGFAGMVRTGRKKALTTPPCLGKPILPQGQLAQLVERPVYTGMVIGSNPILPIKATFPICASTH